MRAVFSGPSQPLDPQQGGQEWSEGDQTDRQWVPQDPGECRETGDAGTPGGAGGTSGSSSGTHSTQTDFRISELIIN